MLLLLRLRLLDMLVLPFKPIYFTLETICLLMVPAILWRGGMARAVVRAIP